MKKWIVMLAAAALMLMLAVGVSAEVVTGTCGADGDNLTWEYNTETFTLTIEGEGEMADYSGLFSSSRIPWYSYRSNIQTVSIADGVTSIGDCAFEKCAALTSITLPDSLTSIASEAFHNLDALTSVTLPASLVSIGYSAFSFCSSLESVTVLGTLSSVSSSAFDGCPSWTTLNIASSVSSVPSTLLQHSSLEQINVLNPAEEGYVSINGILYTYDSYLDAYTLVRYPSEKKDITSYTVIDKTETIAGSAFSGNTYLQSVTFPDSLISIGYDIFDNCTSLTTLTLGRYLTTVSYEWADGSSVSDIIIPDSVTSMPADLYRAVTIINFTVDDTDGKGYRDIDGVLYYYDAEKEALTLVQYGKGRTDTSYTVADGTTKIGEYSFYYRNSLEEVIMPDTVTTIGEYAFYSCNNLVDISISNALKTINDYAFGYCSSLKSITFPASLNTIDRYAFSGCTYLKDITFLNSNRVYLGWGTFENCTALRSVYFHGTTPSMSSDTFYNTHPTLTLYYIDSTEGWTNPTWEYNGVTYNTATFVPATHHTVTLPSILVGTTSTASGSDYTFSLPADAALYTYSITATMSGEPVSITDNGDGTYTIPGVTGDLVITASRTPNGTPALLLSDSAACTIHDGCLTGLSAGQTAGEILSLFDNLSDTLSVHTADGTSVSSSTYVGTGYTVRLTVDGTVYDTLTIVIRGDANGDRYADELDLLFLRRYYAGYPAAPVHPLAGDINGDGTLTRADVMLLSRTLAGWTAASAESTAAFRLFRPTDDITG